MEISEKHSAVEDILFAIKDALDGDHGSRTVVKTFAEAGILAANDGLVIKLADGSEYQLSVVRSK
jgi:hypothetical protein